MSRANYFYLIGYPVYSGYRVEHDPVLTVYMSAPASGTTGLPGIGGIIIVGIIGIIVVIVAAIVLRRRGPKDKSGMPPPPQA